MKKQITIMLAIILALPLVFAMYGGESEIREFPFETDNCTIVPNETEGINFTFIDNTILIEPAINFVGNFNITCYDWLTKETYSSPDGSFPSGRAIRGSPLVINEVESNETIVEEVIEDTEEYIEVEEEVIIEEPKSKLGRIIGALALLLVIIIILLISFKKDKIEEEDEI